jgi:flagellar motor switch protein FliG
MGKPKSQTAISAYQRIMGKEEPAAKKDAGKGLLKTGRPSIGREAPKKTAEQVPTRLPKLGLKSGLKTGGKIRKVPEKPSKFRRAAQFMVLIGSDEASRILSQLDPAQVEAISKEIVSIRSIAVEEAEAVLEEFHSLLSPAYGYSGSSSGGVEEARRHLYAAFGPEKGEAMLVKAVPGAAENPFDFLSDFSGEQLSLLFKEESPAACAMVFSRLPSKLTAAALASMRPERKLDIVKRIAHLRETSPEVIEQTAAALREKARHFGRKDDVKVIDGKGALAAILKHSGMGFGSRLIEELEENDPSLGREMKDRLYTLEDVCGAADRPIQEKLRSMDDREIALLLRGRSEAFTLKITGNLSSVRADRVREESEIMGPVPKVETEAAGREFLAWFRLNREEGRILMLSGEDVLV